MHPGTLSARRLAVIFTTLLLVGLALVWPALSYPLTYDDLHLVRSFSAEELRGSFTGNWDSSGIETPGYRPFTVLFNHTRYAIFGESVLLHRLFLVALYAFYLSLIVWIATRLRLDWRLGLAAAVLSMTAKYSFYHYAWVADGIHLPQGLSFGIAVVLLFRFLERGSWLAALGSLLVALAGVLTREDTLAMMPLIMLLGYAYTLALSAVRPVTPAPLGKRAALYTSFIPGAPALVDRLGGVLRFQLQTLRDDRARWLRLGGYGIVLFCLSVGLLLLRDALVPAAESPELNIKSAMRHVMFSLNVMGLTYDGPAVQSLIIGWQLLLTVLVVAACVCAPRSFRPMALVWLVGLIVTSAPGLNVERVNLLLFPVTCAAFLIAELIAMLRGASPRLLALGVLVLAWGIGGSFYVSRVAMEGLHPASYETVRWNNVLIYGEDATRATIPEVRRAATANQLARFGISSDAEFAARYPVLVNEAIAVGVDRPVDDATLFIPRIPMFER